MIIIAIMIINHVRSNVRKNLEFNTTDAKKKEMG